MEKTESLVKMGMMVPGALLVSRQTWSHRPRGPQGLPGLRGIPGLPGAKGAAGHNGHDGHDGHDGKNGANGKVGPRVQVDMMAKMAETARTVNRDILERLAAPGSAGHAALEHCGADFFLSKSHGCLRFRLPKSGSLESGE